VESLYSRSRFSDPHWSHVGLSLGLGSSMAPNGTPREQGGSQDARKAWPRGDGAYSSPHSPWSLFARSSTAILIEVVEA
jgi:hypothetical protein